MNMTVALGIRFALDLAVKATVLFAVTGVFLFALRRAPAAARHLVGTAGLAAAIALPLLTAGLPRFAVPLLPGLEPAAVEDPSGPAGSAEPRPRAARASSSEEAAGLAGSSRLETAPSPGESAARPTSTRRGGGSPVAWLAIALGAWAGGALLVGARLAVGWARVRRIVRGAEPMNDAGWTGERDELARHLGMRRHVELLESEAVPVAMTSGFLRPLLLLGRAARTWAIERRRIVLLHELAHVRRGDWLALLVAETAVAIYWFHPAAWLLARQVRRDGEHASDDLVLAAGTKPSVYAGHLLGIFRSLSTPAHPVAPVLDIARPSHFEARLKAILDPAPARRDLGRGRALLSAAAVLAGAVLIAAAQPWAPSRAGAAILPEDHGTAAGLLPALPPGKTHSAAACPKASAKPVRARGAVRVSAPGPPSTSPSTGAELAAPSEPSPEPLRSLPAVWKILPGLAREKLDGFVRAGKGGERGKKSGSAWYSRGMDFHNEERYDEAIEAFQKAIEAGYREDAASYNIACGYALKGDRDRAFEWLNRAMDAGFDLQRYLGRDDDLDGLKSDPRWKELKKAVREHRSSRREAQARSAAARYERVLARRPPDPRQLFEVGQELLSVERYDLSAKAFQAAANAGYRVGTSLYNGACALARAGRTGAALDQLQKALDAGFDQPDLFRRDDDLDNVRGEPRFAALAEQARDLSLPGYGSDRYAFGSSWRRSKWRDAAKKFEEYARKNPQSGRAWFNLGYAQLAADRPEAAAEAFEKAVNLSYRKPTTMYNLACSYARADQKDRAFDWLFKALDAGFEGSETIRSDDDLDSLRGDPRYRKAIEIARKRERSEED